jgi:hypothetical protein
MPEPNALNSLGFVAEVQSLTICDSQNDDRESRKSRQITKDSFCESGIRDAPQPRDCMQWSIVTNRLRTRALDRSHGICNGGGRGQQVGSALDDRIASVGEIAIGRQQLDDRAQALPIGIEVRVV